MKNTNSDSSADVVLIGAGIMSATLGTFLRGLQPNWQIHIYERLADVSTESSDAWNNAGTGHSALCELNYTPQLKDGAIEVSKAIKIIEQFELSKQFWASLVDAGMIADPREFIRSVPHMSLVRGEEDVAFLRKRYAALQQYRLFQDMLYTEDRDQISQWVPLMMQGRNTSEPIAVTWSDLGTDVNYGALSRILINNLTNHGCQLHLQHEIIDLKQHNGRWHLTIKNMIDGTHQQVSARFVFIGAGGGSLHLLQKSGIQAGKGYGGFPVSGQWLVCKNPDIVKQHNAKVYGKASVGAPPMSVPHLDKRVINGEDALLFGPFAGFTTKFLKHGSFQDLFRTLNLANIRPMLTAGVHNFALEHYLIQQVRLSFADRMQELRTFYPEARDEDWHLAVAGNRVQVIKKDSQKGGILQFGTELVKSADGSLAALLGASPGASTSVSIMLELLEQCFPGKVSNEWAPTLRRWIPSYGQKLEHNPALVQHVRDWTIKSLCLQTPSKQTDKQ
ncbi:malate dehydrogenase (quinone) [Snodgrassella communis]|uniref:malate dehydrogenase (quinone) n=1 Tax=Snodgrassella communis TaxID=2946699 RepID=UPI001EF42B92|nr:malate dehydrogenase (quinone) [Snodgrassella communis]